MIETTKIFEKYNNNDKTPDRFSKNRYISVPDDYIPMSETGFDFALKRAYFSRIRAGINLTCPSRLNKSREFPEIWINDLQEPISFQAFDDKERSIITSGQFFSHSKRGTPGSSSKNFVNRNNNNNNNHGSNSITCRSAKDEENFSFSRDEESEGIPFQESKIKSFLIPTPTSISASTLTIPATSMVSTMSSTVIVTATEEKSPTIISGSETMISASEQKKTFSYSSSTPSSLPHYRHNKFNTSNNSSDNSGNKTLPLLPIQDQQQKPSPSSPFSPPSPPSKDVVVSEEDILWANDQGHAFGSFDEFGNFLQPSSPKSNSNSTFTSNAHVHANSSSSSSSNLGPSKKPFSSLKKFNTISAINSIANNASLINAISRKSPINADAPEFVPSKGGNHNNTNNNTNSNSNSNNPSTSKNHQHVNVKFDPYSYSDLNSKTRWFYRDPQGVVQGPFTSQKMHDWYCKGYFPDNLPLRREDDDAFEPLAMWRIKCYAQEPFELAISRESPSLHQASSSILSSLSFSSSSSSSSNVMNATGHYSNIISNSSSNSNANSNINTKLNANNSLDISTFDLMKKLSIKSDPSILANNISNISDGGGNIGSGSSGSRSTTIKTTMAPSWNKPMINAKSISEIQREEEVALAKSMINGSNSSGGNLYSKYGHGGPKSFADLLKSATGSNNVSDTFHQHHHHHSSPASASASIIDSSLSSSKTIQSISHWTPLQKWSYDQLKSIVRSNGFDIIACIDFLYTLSNAEDVCSFIKYNIPTQGTSTIIDDLYRFTEQYLIKKFGKASENALVILKNSNNSSNLHHNSLNRSHDNNILTPNNSNSNNNNNDFTTVHRKKY